jgi:hypothetical protein
MTLDISDGSRWKVACSGWVLDASLKMVVTIAAPSQHGRHQRNRIYSIWFDDQFKRTAVTMQLLEKHCNGNATTVSCMSCSASRAPGRCSVEANADPLVAVVVCAMPPKEHWPHAVGLSK